MSFFADSLVSCFPNTVSWKPFHQLSEPSSAGSAPTPGTEPAGTGGAAPGSEGGAPGSTGGAPGSLGSSYMLESPGGLSMF